MTRFTAKSARGQQSPGNSAPHGDLPPREAALLLTILVFAGSTFPLAQSIVVPVLPTLQVELGTDTAGIAWVMTAFLIVASVSTPIIGRLGDIHGKRRILILTMAVFACGCVVAGLATSLPVLISGRAIQGVSGGTLPLIFGIIRDQLPRAHVARGIAIFSGAFALGSALGTVIPGLILAHLDYHWLGWMTLLFVVLATLTLAFVPESDVRASGHITFAAPFLLGAWLTCLLLWISRAGSWGWGSAVSFALLFGAIAIGIVWWLSESHTSDPLIDIAMLRDPTMLAANATTLAVAVGIYSGFVLIPQVATAAPPVGFGTSVLVGGILLVPWPIGVVICSPLGGRLTERYGPGRPLFVGTLLGVLGFSQFALVHDHLWQLLLLSAVLGSANGFAYPALTTLVVAAVRPDQTGVATGIHSVTRNVGGAFGTQLSATLLAATAVGGVMSERGFEAGCLVGAVGFTTGLVSIRAIPRGAARRTVIV